MSDEPSSTWTPLRVSVVIAAALGTAFWLGSLVWWWRIPAARRDGFELMGVALSTAYFISLVLPTWVIGLRGRWLGAGAVLGCVALALASDTLFPWLPWR